MQILCSSSLYYKLLSIVSSFNLTQIVTEPTHISKTTSTLCIVTSSVEVIKVVFHYSSSSKCRSSWFISGCSSSLRVKKPKAVTRKFGGMHLLTSIQLWSCWILSNSRLHYHMMRMLTDPIGKHHFCRLWK